MVGLGLEEFGDSQVLPKLLFWLLIFEDAYDFYRFTDLCEYVY